MKRKLKTNINLSGMIACAVLLTAITFDASGAERAKPVVAIKEAKIGEGVSKFAVQYLNTSTLWDEMEAAIQKNRKFELVSRKKEVLQELRDEQEFAKSDLAAGNAASEGQFKNANFLIIPTVQDFKFYRSSQAVPNLDNKYKRTDSGMLEVNAQVLDTSTGSIKTTFYLKSSFATKTEIVNSKSGAPNSVHFTKMAKDVSAQMTDQLVDAVFPMQIINIQGKQVFINRGQDGGLEVGTVLKVFRPGIALIDPDTGESLGSAETEIGKIKVTRVNPKFTIAEVAVSEEPFDKSDIVRK
jgi:hypothetical protein